MTGTLGYEKAEVTAGGVPLGEVDASTLESRLAPGVVERDRGGAGSGGIPRSK